MIVDAAPMCDLDDTHIATVHCPDCDEVFCEACDALIHARKKNKSHTREAIEVAPEVIPCDVNPEHVATMHCETCEENMCADCDFLLHSRKKTAAHRRFEGARNAELAAALIAQAAAEDATAQAQADLDHMTVQEEDEEDDEPAASTAAAATTVSASAAAPTSSASKPASPAKPRAAPRPSAGTPAVSSSPATNVAASASASAAAGSSSISDSADKKGGGGKKKLSSAERVAENKAAWNNLRTTLCRNHYQVGHWLGLTTDDRKELAVTLCQELLFNPQPSAEGADPAATVTVEWAATSYWTSHEIDVECTKRSGDPADASKQKVIVYKVHVGDAGRLEDFEIVADGVSSGCAVM